MEPDYIAKAIDCYGIVFNLDKVIEECAELIVALQHYKNGREGSLEEVLEEMVDVHIMMNCLEYIFQDEDMTEICESKWAKFKNKIDAGVVR